MDKREFRQLKRILKKAGNKKSRKRHKDILRLHPDEAHWYDEPEYGYCETKNLKHK